MSESPYMCCLHLNIDQFYLRLFSVIILDNNASYFLEIEKYLELLFSLIWGTYRVNIFL